MHAPEETLDRSADGGRAGRPGVKFQRVALRSAKWQTLIDNMAASGILASMNPLPQHKPADTTRSASPRRVVRFKSRGSSLGLPATRTQQLIHQVERGFSFKALETLQSRSGIALLLLASLIGLPERTLARRKASGRLAADESERLLRISSIFERAVELFEGDVAAAVRWLSTPKKALGNHPPLAYSRTELGAREVENLIGRLEHGVFS